MPQQRVREAVLAAERSGSGTARVDHLCAIVAAELPVDGVGLSVTGGPGQHSRLAATDDVSGRIEDLQVLLGQGPCVDAVATGTPVLVDDVADPAALSRWPAFIPAVEEIGVRASFALPLVVGDLRIGAMDLYRRDAGTLAPKHLEHAQDIAAAAVEVLLQLQHDRRDGHDSTRPPGWAMSSVVHQATGMVMVQLGVDGPTAFAALRARAYREGRALQEVARDVVDRRRRLDDGQEAGA